MGDTILVGRWDCTYCGRKRISGEEYACPTCGKARDDDVEFYLDEEEIVAKNKNENPDWKCKYCDTLNPDDSKICVSCGSQRDESNETYFENRNKKQKYKDMNRTDYHDYTIDMKKARKKASNILSIMLVFAVVLFGFFLYDKLVPKTIKITDKLWTTTIETQVYKTVREGDFNVPSGGRIADSYKKIHHYDTVQSGYRTEHYTERVFSHNETYYTTTSLGNGKFRKTAHTRPVYKNVQRSRRVPNYVQVPRYMTYYEYDIDKWVDDEPLVKNGNHTQDIKYSDFSEKSNYREKTRYTKYFVVYDMKKKKDIKKEIDETLYNSLQLNTNYKMKNNKILIQ